jgi:hypothetical protein
MVQLNGPGLSATAAIKALAKVLVEFSIAEWRDSFRKRDSVQRIRLTAQHEPSHPMLNLRH